MGESDYKLLQERARKIINKWPEYKKASIVKNGVVTPWVSNEPTDIELAWAAGFIDGEGCIRISKQINKIYPNRKKQSVSYQLMIQATQTEVSSMEKLKSLFNCGSITK